MQKIYTVGGQRLEGEVHLSGSKNVTLAILAATLLPQTGQTILHNVPQISDVLTMLEMLRHLGMTAQWIAPGTVALDATALTSHCAPYELIKKMRASFSVLGPLVARFGKASVALPGGCDIGARPVDYHLKGLEQMGVHTTVEHGFVQAEAPDGLQGSRIYLDFPSVGATTHLITAASLASGITTISNAAEEPDVVATANIINAMGGKVRGAGTKEIIVEGVKALRGTEFAIDKDRIEAGTFAVAAAITGGDLYIRGAVEEHVQPVTRKLVEVGLEVRFDDDGVRVRLPKGRSLQATMIEASPHPGFPTDMQPPFAALLTLAEGTSVITEKVYERRFKYIDELARMGADIKTKANAAVIIGVPRLTGAPVAGSDLRATAALILAGLAAEGQTEVSGIQYLDRGYDDFVGKLSGVGARIWRTDKAPEAVITPDSGEGSRVFRLSQEIGIDLGTTNVLVYVRGRGIVMREPSVVAMDTNTHRPRAVGEKAREMLGKTPGNIMAIRPITEGVIADYTTTQALLNHIFSKVCGANRVFKPRVLLAVPSGVTSVERRAVKQAALAAGAGEAWTIEEAKAAAIGAGMPISAPGGNLVVDIGGGTTDIAVLSLDGIVLARSLRVGGMKLDEVITRHIRSTYNLMIGDRTAEEIKITIGSVTPQSEEMTMEVRGRDLLTGLPQTVAITSEEVRECMLEPISQIIVRIKNVLEKTPPELASDIIERGIVLTGGTALLRGLDQLVSEATQVPTIVAKDPLSCVALGTGKALEQRRIQGSDMSVAV